MKENESVVLSVVMRNLCKKKTNSKYKDFNALLFWSLPGKEKNMLGLLLIIALFHPVMLPVKGF